jgi:hypothetical protein
MIARSMVLVALGCGGCIATVANGGNWQHGEPPEPNPAGYMFRAGGGFGAGDGRGWLAAAAEYRRVGDFNALGLGVEGGLFLIKLTLPTKEPDEEGMRLEGRMLGNGFTLRGRLAAGGWGDGFDGEGALVLEGGLGVGFDFTSEKAGPAGLALMFSTFRAQDGDRDPLWSYGLSFGGSLPLDRMWDKLP